MIQPNKWRETMDPFSIKFKNFTLKEVLGYPHAGNDVFYVKGVIDSGKEVKAFLKVARQKTANIKTEIEVLKKLKLKFVPKLLDFSNDQPEYILTKEIKGERLSNLINNNKGLKLKSYMKAYGKLLAQIHKIEINCDPVKERDFNLKPEFYEKNGLQHVERYLFNCVTNDSYCYIHGDCHYANILWKGKKITGLLDFELSGYGSREYDLAWAITQRPEQNFFITKKLRDTFLDSYSKQHSFCKQTFNYYLVLFSMFFYNISIKNNLDNKDKFLEVINEIVAENF